MTTRNELLFPEEKRDFLTPYLPPKTSLQSPTPFTTLTFATSLDSSLSLSPGQQTTLSGPESKSMTHYLRSQHDAILIGVGTAIADNPSLNCRIRGVGGYGGQGLIGQPRPIVVDPKGRWELNSQTKVLELAREGKGKAPWIVTAEVPEEGQKRLLERVGGCHVVMEAQSGTIAWSDILRTVKEKGIDSIMIEGGGVIINSLLSKENSSLIDSVIVTIAPTWLGQGGVVVSPPRDQGNNLPVARLGQTKWQQLGDDVVLCGTLN